MSSPTQRLCPVGQKEKEKIDAAKEANKVAKKVTKSKQKTLAAVAQYRIGVPVLHDAPDVAMNDSDRSVPIRTRLADAD